VNNSAVLRVIDGMIPATANEKFSDFRRVLVSGPYAQVFGALGAEGVPLVAAPDPRVVDSPAVGRAQASIVKIVGVAPSCSHRIEGTGFVYAPDHILTNAHVVAGVTQGPMITTTRGSVHARVVLYDPHRDIAVLYVPGLNTRALSFTGPAQVGANAIVAGYPENGGFQATPARVGGTEEATSPDIYQSAQVTRQIYAVRARVEPGNSGGPLLTPGGRVYGVVFAAAISVRDTGYALTASEVQSDASRGANATVGVSTQGCD
jgi:S1-C subfamily serine protease